MSHYLALVDEADGDFGVTVPDCPGCVAMGRTVDEAIENAVAALREWMADRIADGLEPPPARSWQALQQDPALAVDVAAGAAASYIPLLLDSGRLVRANISVDAGLLDQIDSAAKARGLTRSSFLASAAREKIAARR